MYTYIEESFLPNLPAHVNREIFRVTSNFRKNSSNIYDDKLLNNKRRYINNILEQSLG